MQMLRADTALHRRVPRGTPSPPAPRSRCSAAAGGLLPVVFPSQSTWGGGRGCLEGVWAPSAAPTLPPPKAGQAERALPADPGCLRARFHLCYHLPGDVGRSFAEPPWPLGPVFLNQAVAGTNSPLPGSPRPGVSGRGPGAAPGTGPILRPAPGPGQRSLPGAFPAPRLPRENNWCGWSPCSPPPRLYIIAYFN